LNGSTALCCYQSLSAFWHQYCLAVCCVRCVSGCASRRPQPVKSRKLHPHISSLFSCGTGLALFVFSSDIPIDHCNVVQMTKSCFRHLMCDCFRHLMCDCFRHLMCDCFRHLMCDCFRRSAHPAQLAAASIGTRLALNKGQIRAIWDLNLSQICLI